MQRWLERFDNYKQALDNFNETYNCIKQYGLNKVYTMALVQAYEMAFELAWKTLKDYLDYQGLKTDTPRETIKTAFLRNVIQNGDLWVEMMEARNKTSHVYKEDLAKSIAEAILNKYYDELNNLEKFLDTKINE